MDEKIEKVRKYTILAVETTGCLLLLAIALLVFVQVIMRKVFNSPLAWTEEVVRIFLVWTSFLGAYVALAEGQHLLMSVFIDRMSARRKNRFKLMTNSMLLLLLGIVAYYGYEFIAQMGFIPMPVTGIKNFYVYGVMWVSMVLMLAETLLVEFRILRAIRGNEE